MAEGDTDTALPASVVEAGAPPAPPPADAKPARKPGKRKAANAVTSQADATAPRSIDPETGLELDEHGLPTARVARRRWLAAANIEDPALTSAAGEQENIDG